MITSSQIKSYFANTPQISFEVTERCNLHCKYCGYGELYNNKGKRFNRNLDINDAICLLKSIKGLWEEGYDATGISNVYVSFYGGEPLLNIRLIKEIVSFIEEYMSGFNRKFIYTMTTNAILLKDHINYLVEKDFHLLISLDGDCYASSYRVYHNGIPAFNDIINNLDFVQLELPQYFDRNISFNSVLSNRSTVKGIIEFIKQKYSKIPTISEINTVGVDENMSDTFQQMYRPKLSYFQEGITTMEGEYDFINSPQFERIAKYFRMYSPYFFFNYNELLFLCNDKRSKTPTGTCIPFSKKIFLTVDGKIMPCERIGYKYVLGEIKNGTIHLDFPKIADIYNEYYIHIKKVCSKCKDYHGCLNCFFNTGQLESVNAKCEYFVSKKAFDAMEKEVCDFIRQYPLAYEYIMTKYEVL